MRIVKNEKKRLKITIWLALLVLAVVCLVALLAVHVNDNKLHRELTDSVAALQSSLIQHEINTEKTSGCGRPYSEIGKGHKSCSIALNFSDTVGGESEARAVLTSFLSAISSTHLYSQTGEIPNFADGDSDLSFGVISYRSNREGRVCGLDYDYEQAKNSISIGFSCDDTSWFVRTFEG